MVVSTNPARAPSVELIYGLKMHGESRLFSAAGPIINPVEEYCSGGIGSYMADFLAARMYGSSFMSVHQCVILAAYILFQAKEHVEGCGGESHISVLRHNKPSGTVASARIGIFTNLLKDVDSKLSEILLGSADLTAGEDFTAALEVIAMDRMMAKKHIDDLSKSSLIGAPFEALPVDELGIVIEPPLDLETSGERR